MANPVKVVAAALMVETLRIAAQKLAVDAVAVAAEETPALVTKAAKKLFDSDLFLLKKDNSKHQLHCKNSFPEEFFSAD